MTPELPELLKLVYVSTATRVLDDADIADLLAVARSRNEACGITGVLLYSGGRFMQHLEGHDDDVAAVFDSIQRDPRHEDVRLLTRRPIAVRLFSEWWMGFENPDGTAFAVGAAGGPEADRLLGSYASSA